ncbi:MAG: CBU_1789 family Dot/Icm type IV secretion system effector [Rhodoferax sp.]
MIPLETDAPWQIAWPHAAQLGESPYWDAAEQRLYWVDIAERQLLRARPGEATVEHWSLPSEPGCVAPARRGGWVLALRDGIYRAQQWQGALHRIAHIGYDPRQHRANDGRCDAQGRFWIGTLDETRQLANAALYCLDARQAPPSLRCVLGQPGATPDAGAPDPAALRVSTANGLAFSPQEDTLYWADTRQHTVWAWDFDADTARLTRQRVWAQWPSKPVDWEPDPLAPADPQYLGRPDGACVDALGNYWVALYEGRRVCQLAPNGQLLRAIATPVQCPTMPCLGGPDLRTLYVTSARAHRGEAECAALPASGQVIALQVPTPGLPVARFAD